jgi:phospho-N-acetylmuramoyl-pentapeptide-transferase
MLYFNAARALVPFLISFSIGIFLAPILIHYLYAHKIWKKKGGKESVLGDTAGTPIFNALHKEREISTPRMGGILVWGTTCITTFVLAVVGILLGGSFSKLDFINRGQTWLPLFALMCGGLIGLIDDILEVRFSKGGLPLRFRLIAVGIFSLFAGWWFYSKLGIASIAIPFTHGMVFPLGIYFIPFFIFVTLILYGGGIIDGLDGLAGGIFGFIFMAYAGIAFAQNQISLAALCATIAGATFAFLWFNIPPARFYLSETGTMALTLTLAVVSFSTDVLGGGIGVFVLPIIAFPLCITVISAVIQILSKKIYKRKVFIIAPVHHHFEAIGWPPYKVVMRYWVVAILSGVFGVSIALLT